MANLTLRPLLRAGLPRELLLSCTIISTARQFSVLNRPPPNYPGHIPLTKVEKLGLAFGSAIGSLIDPRRGDLIAALGEATATPYFITSLHKTMLSNATGRRILRLRPRITSTTLSIPYLLSLPPTTLGHTYATWLATEHVSPDTRAPVTYIDNEEEAYVMQRYRECHDFYHAITGMPVIVEGETIVKTFEFANLGLPMTGLAMVGGYLRLKDEERRRFREYYGPWALANGGKAESLINVFWEEELERDVGELRKELGIEMPESLRDIRKRAREKKKAEKRAKEQSTSGAS